MRIEVGTSLEVGSVAATAHEWLERLNQEGAEVELDVSRIQRLDTAGMQLMLSLLGEIESRNGSFRLRGSSEEFDRVQFLLGLRIPAVQGVG